MRWRVEQRDHVWLGWGGMRLPGGARSADGGALLVTKLVVPELPRGPLIRSRLLDVLDRATQGPLTLLAAPPGAGKTVLLSSWLAGGRPPGPAAWVTCDAHDNPTRLWAHVLAALRGSGAVPDGTGLAGTAAPLSPGNHGFLVQLLNGLAALDGPVVVVLDDLHEVSSPGVLADLRFLVRHAPPQLRLVLASRVDPHLPLHRLRVAGKISEIRAADLAFTLAETARLLADADVHLAPSDLESLWCRTEGWAAGLRLAALSLRGHPDPVRFVAEFTGDDCAVAGYLAEEVLAGQPAEVQQFMLQTSVADRLCGGLADALVGRPGGEAMLARLEREHAFVSALGTQRDWYRYHPLFAQLLHAELNRQSPAEVPELHRRAAAWYGANGLPTDAVHHALVAHDVGLAVELLRAHWFEMLSDGRAAVLAGLLDRLPAERLGADPELAVAAAVCRLAVGAAEEADAWLRVADEAAASSDGGGGRFTTARTIASLHRARLLGDLTAAVAAAEALRSLPSDPLGEDLADGGSRRSRALAGLGAAALWDGRPGAAAVHLEGARAEAERSRRHDVALDAMGHLALVELLNGRLTRAAELAAAVLERAGRGGWPAGPALTCAELALAGVRYHRNDLAGANDALERAAVMARTGSDRSLALAVAAAEAWLLVCAGHEDAADGLAGLRSVVRQPGTQAPALLAGAARRVEARLLITLGDPAGGLDLFDAGEFEQPVPEDAVVLARLRLALGDPRGAARLLALDRTATAVELPLPARIEAWLLDAVAHLQMDEHDRAGRSLEHALELAGPEGFRRVFVEGGVVVRSLLAEHLERGAVQPGLAELLDELGQPATPAALVVLDVPMEALTERERIVLRYLSSMLSASEIAGELYVSVNTVKTHVRSIYRKLDTNRRRDAVRRAKELQLL